MGKKRSILPRYMVVALTAIILVLSCSHQGASNTDDEAAQMSEAEDSGSGAKAQQDNGLADSKDLAQADNSAAPAADADGLAPPSKDDQIAPKANDDALAELESTVADPKPSDAAAEAPKADESTPPPAEAAVEPPSENLGDTAKVDEATKKALSESAPAPEASSVPPVAENTAPAVTAPNPEVAPAPEKAVEPTIAPVVTKPHRAHRRHNGGPKDTSTVVAHADKKGMQAPKIPGRAIVKKGSNLNRFYFVRKGDNAKQLSQLIYGNPDRASELMAWNGAQSLKPGTLIYYASPIDAKDEKMQAFYQERNVPVEEYNVENSDTLFTIAQKKLGDKRSWKEIATINGMETSASVEAGQKLALYPADLSQYTPNNVAGNLAKNDAKTEAQEQAEAPAPAPVEPPPVAVAPPPVPTPPKFVAPPKAQGFDVAQLVQQNIFAVGIGGVILILLVALTALNRKKKSGQEDFSDENFSPRARRK